MALSVFALSSVFLLAMSGVFHMLPKEDVGRAALQRLDHAAIFLLIAGTFTPIHVILFRGFARWGVLAIVWSLAVAGIVFGTIFFSDIPEWLNLSFYLVLGWVGISSGVLAWRLHNARLVIPLALGALAYTFGALLEFFRFPVLIPHMVGPHEVFHLAVLVGIACHWIFIRQCTSMSDRALLVE